MRARLLLLAALTVPQLSHGQVNLPNGTLSEAVVDLRVQSRPCKTAQARMNKGIPGKSA